MIPTGSYIKLYSIIIVYLIIAITIGVYLLKFLLTKFRIEIKKKKEMKKLFLISAIPYIIGIFGRTTASIVNSIINMFLLLGVFFLVNYFIRKFFLEEERQSMKLSLIWFLTVIVINIVLITITAIIIPLL